MNILGIHKRTGYMRKHFRLATLSFAVFGLWGALANAQADLTVDPLTATSATGGTFTVDVNVSNVSDLYGYQLDLTFNPSVLSAVSITEGSFLQSGGNTTTFLPGTIDNVGGTIALNADTINGAVPGVTGSGELIAFTFDAIGAGTSALGIQN